MLWLRMFLCAVVASVLVLTMASFGVRWFYDPEEQGESTAHFIESVGLQSLFEGPEGDERRREQQREFVREGPRERPETPPPVELPERQVSGFVQLEFTVFPDGSVEDVEVVGARPSGIYEEQARQRIEARDFSGQVSPAEEDGERHSEVIEFTVPASEVDED